MAWVIVDQPQNLTLIEVRLIPGGDLIVLTENLIRADGGGMIE